MSGKVQTNKRPSNTTSSMLREKQRFNLELGYLWGVCELGTGDIVTRSPGKIGHVIGHKTEFVSCCLGEDSGKRKYPQILWIGVSDQ